MKRVLFASVLYVYIDLPSQSLCEFFDPIAVCKDFESWQEAALQFVTDTSTNSFEKYL